MALASGGAAAGQAVGGLKIYEDQAKRGAVTIQGLEEAAIRNTAEALRLLEKGSQRRQVAETKMNSESSYVLPSRSQAMSYVDPASCR